MVPQRADVESCSCRTRGGSATPAEEGPSRTSFVYTAFYMGNRKKGGRGKRKKKKPTGAFLFVHLYQIHLSFHIQKGLFFPLQEYSLILPFFFAENSWVCGLRGFFLALNEMDMAY